MESSTKTSTRIIAGIAVIVVLTALGFILMNPFAKLGEHANTKASVTYQEAIVQVPFEQADITINPAIAAPFAISEITNIAAIEQAYGFTFTSNELADLEQHKFVIKNLLDTNMAADGLPVGDTMREFVALYKKVAGDTDYKERTQANALFISSDVMMHLLSVLSADLLKETENKYLYTSLLDMTQVLYDEAAHNAQNASSTEEAQQWVKVRNYFALPYALLSTTQKPFDAADYWDSSYSENGQSVDDMQAAFDETDATADSHDKAIAFVKTLKLGNADEATVLADLKQVYDATEPRGTPVMFASEFRALPPHITVQVPFTLFKPRGTYTSSSLRRQYFRAVQWYQQIPFLVASKELTTYATRIGELVHNDQNIQNQYKNFSSLIGFVVGESDDLEVLDYATAVGELDAKAYDQQALTQFLDARKPTSKIKALPVAIDPAAGVTRADMIDAMRGMRFMSQKFIPDSYWTSKLTQGDEQSDVAGQKLPDKASVLQVMSILGSPYATSRLTDLPFYALHKQAIDTQLGELTDEAKRWNNEYWMSNLYTSSLWTVSGMFEWLEAHRGTLPAFMQSPRWNAKTLLTASGFWTELRHTSLLYAKQSFAELGGGGGDSCDPRIVPEPAKGYVEPQAEAYDRLLYTAKRLDAEYKARGFELQNQPKLEEYLSLLNLVREYTKLQLENNLFTEPVITKKRQSYDDNAECTEYFIDPGATVERSEDAYLNPVSRWEELRVALPAQMARVLPDPIEGPVMQIKDKRAAVVADVHTDMAGGVLTEGTGVPRVMFVAVKDANGPRLTVGFTYSHYETIQGKRLTDEQWQDNFYTDSGDYMLTYTPKQTWPDTNLWFRELLGSK
jgi:hypothetical protein